MHVFQEFISVIKQRVEIFDRLEVLKKEIGDDERDFIAKLVMTSFQSPVCGDDTHVGEGGTGKDGGELDYRYKKLIGSAMPLLKIFTAIDDAYNFFQLHSDFLEVSCARLFFIVNSSERSHA